MSRIELESYFDRLWPICRSITGNGFRASLEILKELIPLEQVEVPTGTEVLDWRVPREWNIEDAYILDEMGNRVVDFKKNNLHVVGYSTPVDAWFTLEELEKHLHSLPTQPKAVPYVTSYYKEYWGFCLSHEERQNLKGGRYRAVIRSTLEPGHLTYGHLVLPSTTGGREEILFSSYLCHPSLANNELSGPLALAGIYRQLKDFKRRRYNYRFFVGPETIGAITYLARYGDKFRADLKAGFVLTCCGDRGPFNYKKTRNGDRLVDRLAIRYLKESGIPFRVHDFWPSGSDERQYCSPGFDLPVGSLMRTIYAQYPEYHTSLDDKRVISFKALQETIDAHVGIVSSLEESRTYRNLSPFGEPMLSKRDAYPTLSEGFQAHSAGDLALYILNFSDGQHDLVDIAERAGCKVHHLEKIAELLVEKKLLEQGW